MLRSDSKVSNYIITYLVVTEEATEEALCGLGFWGTFGAFWSGSLLMGLILLTVCLGCRWCWDDHDACWWTVLWVGSLGREAVLPGVASYLLNKNWIQSTQIFCDLEVDLSVLRQNSVIYRVLQNLCSLIPSSHMPLNEKCSGEHSWIFGANSGMDQWDCEIGKYYVALPLQQHIIWTSTRVSMHFWASLLTAKK